VWDRGLRLLLWERHPSKPLQAKRSNMRNRVPTVNIYLYHFLFGTSGFLALEVVDLLQKKKNSRI
jgi:hypothetical protein